MQARFNLVFTQHSLSAMAQITNFILQMTLLVIQLTAEFGSLESPSLIKILHYDCWNKTQRVASNGSSMHHNNMTRYTAAHVG